MDKWYQPADIFEIPGMPRSYVSLKKVAEQENWTSRLRGGIGGGIEYAFDTLPLWARQYLIAEAEKSSAAPSTHNDRKEAKVEILGAYRAFCKKLELDHTTTAARKIFSDHYNAGQVWVSKICRRIIDSFTETTLFRWLKTIKESIEALGGLWGHRRGWRMVESDPEVRDICMGMLLCTCAATHRMLVARLPEKKLPSESTIRAWKRWWKKDNPQQWAIISDPARWKNCFKAACGDAYEQITHANQLWEIDGTKGDIFAADGKRWTILQLIDVYSRRLLSFVCETSSAGNVIEGLLRKAFTIWGIPEKIKLDNGKEFTSTRLKALCLQLDIEMDHCPFRTPERKPAIERSFGTMTRDLLHRLPGFCGSSVAERQEIRARNGEVNNEVKGSLTAEEIQKSIDYWITTEYEMRPHDGIDGSTPLERWVLNPKPIRKINNERALDLLLAEPRLKNPIVGKKGIRIEKNWYTDVAGMWTHQIGKPVQVRHDPCDDAGRVYVFSPDGRDFLFIADCQELSGESRSHRVAAAKAQQKSVLKIRKVHKDLAEKITAQDPAVLAAKRSIARDKAKNVVPFERVQSIEVPTEIEAAIQGLDTLLHVPVAVEPTPEQQVARAERRAAIEKEEAKRAEQPDHVVFKALVTRADEGKELSAEEWEWIDRYKETSGGATLYQVYKTRLRATG
jgi:putative transposase